MSVAFWITTVVVVATPGTGVLYTVAAGLSRGRRASLIAAAGCTLGSVPHLLAAITGLAAILQASGVAFRTLQYLGAGYLLLLAWRTLRDTGTLHLPPGHHDVPSPVRVVVQGVLINLLNPKLTLFFFAFLPQFVGSGSDSVPSMVRLGGVFMLVTLVVFALYGLFAAGVRDQLVGRPKVMGWLRRAFAGSYLAMAARLAASSR